MTRICLEKQEPVKQLCFTLPLKARARPPLIERLRNIRTTPRDRVPDDLLRHVAPLGWNHISLTDDYLWSEVCIPCDGFSRLNILEEAA